MIICLLGISQLQSEIWGNLTHNLRYRTSFRRILSWSSLRTRLRDLDSHPRRSAICLYLVSHIFRILLMNYSYILFAFVACLLVVSLKAPPTFSLGLQSNVSKRAYRILKFIGLKVHPRVNWITSMFILSPAIDEVVYDKEHHQDGN